MELTELVNNEEVKNKTKIGKTKEVEYNRYSFMNEEENNEFRDSAIKIWAPEGARFFRVRGTVGSGSYNTVEVEYYF